MTIWKLGLWQFLTAGGPIMVPIVLCSLLAAAIIIERLIYYATISINTHRLKQDIFDQLKDGNITQAVAICDTHGQIPLAKILKAGIVRFGAGREEIKEIIEEVSLLEIPKLEQKLNILAVIAHITPLLGLLGTVTGIAGSFHSMQMRAAALNPITPNDLAGGIWEALITTIAGLMVAIPALIFYNYLVSRVANFILDMEHGATELVNLLSQLAEAKAVKRGIKGEI